MLNKILMKAREKYQEATRGRDYQDVLLLSTTNDMDDAYLYNRRAIFQGEICLLEDIFGSLLTNNINDDED